LPAGQDAKSAADLMRSNPQVEFVEPNFLINHDQLRPNALLSGMGRVMPAAGASSATLLRPPANGEIYSGTNYANLTGGLGVPTTNPGLTNGVNPNETNENSPDDPRFSEQWSLRNTGQTGGHTGSDIDTATAWQTTRGSRATVVAVIDSGIDFTHPDLANNEWTNSQPGPNGDLHGWDYITDTGVIKDEQGHGTSIAGIIAAQGNNGTGISGVMWKASLMSLRVLDNTGTGDIADAIEAIDYAVTHGAHVINLSWGTSEESAALKDAIKRALRRGVIVVCSAGNDGLDLDTTPYYPAAFDLNDLIAVASTDNTDQLSTWSNYGRKHVAVGVPGVNLLTTKMGGGYLNVTGTSASAPLVSGIAGLIKTLYPWAGSKDVAKALQSGGRKANSLKHKVSSGAIASAAGALDQFRGMPIPPSPGGNGGGNENGNGGGNGGPTPPPPTPRHVVTSTETLIRLY
jgi:subtilisin family serine protease